MIKREIIRSWTDISMLLEKYIKICVRKSRKYIFIGIFLGIFALLSSRSEKTLSSGICEKPRVALTFDDGPGCSTTARLLDGLKERGITATFFLTGENIPGKEELVLRMQKEGHLIGNHTYSHVQLDKIPIEKARAEVEKTSNRIFEITGIYPVYIRPPYGAWPKNLDLAVEMFPVLWDIDTLDWKSRDVKQILKIVKNEIQDGAIILMHDMYETSVDAALALADDLLEEGYEFVTADQLLLS